MKSEKENENEKEKICSICLEELKIYPTTKLNCHHYFHTNCIILWKEKKNICPICRNPIDPKLKNSKRKSCLTPLELFLLIITFILIVSFSAFMIIKSVKKLKLKKEGKFLETKNENKYKKYFGFNLIFDLMNAKKEDRFKVLKEYGKKIPIYIKYKIENFFDELVEGYDEFVEAINEFKELRKHWNDK